MEKEALFGSKMRRKGSQIGQHQRNIVVFWRQVTLNERLNG